MSKWIKCSDRLPSEPDTEVVFDSCGYLVSNGSHICIARFDRGHGCGKPWADWSDYADIRRGDITHWQPLPPPPAPPTE